MARMTITQKRNSVYRRLLDIRVTVLKKGLQYRLAEVEREKREILRSCLPCENCDPCLKQSCGATLKDNMEPKRYGLRLQHSFEDAVVSEKVVHKVKPERSHSDNSMKLNYPDIIPSASRGHTTLADLKLSHSLKRSLHGIPSNVNQLTSSSSEFRQGSLALHHSHGDLYNSKLRHSSDMFHQSSAKIADPADLNSSETNLTAFLFSRHCRHGYVMKKATDPSEQTKDNIKSKIRAKVVKNYLLQDVFKRLNSTKTLLVRNNKSDGNADKQAGLTPETMQTLERCRYLRLPMKKTVQAMDEQDKDDDKLPQIDIN